MYFGRSLPALAFFCCFGILCAQTDQDTLHKTPFTIGESVILHSHTLNENRILNIYLPLGYSKDPVKTYPVIYLLDGSADEDFIHISGLVQFCSFQWLQIIPESIVVGIANVDRQRDFTFPAKNAENLRNHPTSGGSMNFIRFLSSEVQPFIEEHYRTNSTTTLIGQSLGGLLATEILFSQPDLFDNYIIVSPSLWWDDESLLEAVPIPYASLKSIYVAVGSEGPIMEREARGLYEKLNQDPHENTTLFFHFMEAQNHADALHLAVYDAFEKIFKSQQD